MVIKAKISDYQQVTPPPRGWMEVLIYRVLENYCLQRFNSSIRTVNKRVRPVFYYCVSQTGADWQTFRKRWNVCPNTYRKYVREGEQLAKKTKQGKKFYNEIMTLLKLAIKERRFVSLLD